MVLIFLHRKCIPSHVTTINYVVLYSGVAHGSHDIKGFIFESPILLNDDVTNISLLSVMVGLPVIILVWILYKLLTFYSVLNFFEVLAEIVFLTMTQRTLELILRVELQD